MGSDKDGGRVVGGYGKENYASKFALSCLPCPRFCVLFLVLADWIT